MNEKNINLEKINFTINILFLISMSLSLINEYAATALVLTIIHGLFTFWIRSKPFYSSLEFPGFKMSTITSLIIVVLFMAYILFISKDYINIYIKYILFISVFIIYISMYIKKNRVG